MTSSNLGSAFSKDIRSDILVSVCFGDLSSDSATFDAIARLAVELDTHFRFREIIVIAEDGRQDDYMPLIHRVHNLRLLTVRDGTAFYRKRVIAAEEAIGDVVLLASASELAGIDPIGMIVRAADEECAVLARCNSRFLYPGFGSILVFLGRMAGFSVSSRGLQSLALSRTLLNQLLAHPDPDLALRFPPRDVRMPLIYVKAASAIHAPRDAGFRRCLALLQKLLVYLAPALLMVVTVASALLALLGFFYGLYVVGVWLLMDKVAPGWLTLSGFLSLTAFFMGISIMGLSLGLQLLLARTHRYNFDAVAAEVNRIDLFGQVATDLNVDFERDRMNPRKHSAR